MQPSSVHFQVCQFGYIHAYAKINIVGFPSKTKKKINTVGWGDSQNCT